MGSLGHRTARAYIAARMTEIGLRPYRSRFVHEYAPGFANVIGELRGTVEGGLAPVVIGAHYDTCGNLPGADDNATGVALLFSLAEALQQSERRRTIVFAAFDAEEPPFFLTPRMGSIAFFEQQGGAAAGCALIFDIVGHDFPLPGRRRLIVVTGAESHEPLAQVIGSVGQPRGLNVLAADSKYVTPGDQLDLSDYSIFRTRRRPFLFLSAGHWGHYHRSSDTPDRLDFGKLEAVSRYVERIVAGLDRVALEEPRPADSLKLELRMLRQTLGPLGVVAWLLLRRRAHLDWLAGMLQRLGL